MVQGHIRQTAVAIHNPLDKGLFSIEDGAKQVSSFARTFKTP